MGANTLYQGFNGTLMRRDPNTGLGVPAGWQLQAPGPAAAAVAAKPQHGFTDDFMDTVLGAGRRYMQDYRADQAKRSAELKRPLLQQIAAAPYDYTIGGLKHDLTWGRDALGVVMSPVAGTIHGVMRPFSQWVNDATYDAGFPAYSDESNKKAEAQWKQSRTSYKPTREESRQAVEKIFTDSLGMVAPEAGGEFAGGAALADGPEMAILPGRTVPSQVVAARLVRGKMQPVAPALPGGLPFESMRAGGSLMRGVVANGGPSAARVNAAVQGTRGTVTGRMLQQVHDGAGGTGDVAFQSLDDLDAAHKAAAQPLYDKAFAAGDAPVSNTLGALLRRPALQKGAEIGRGLAQEEGFDPADLGFTPAGEPAGLTRASPRGLDFVKRGLDDVLNASRDGDGVLAQGEGMRAIQQTRKQFHAAIDDTHPDLGDAWRAYAGPTRQGYAMSRGALAAARQTSAEALHDGDIPLSLDEVQAQRLGAADHAVGLARQDPAGFLKSVGRSQVVEPALAGPFGPEAARGLVDASRNAGRTEQAYQNIAQGVRSLPQSAGADAIDAASDGTSLGDHIANALAKRAYDVTFKAQASRAATPFLDRLRIPELADPEVARIVTDVGLGVKTPEEAMAVLKAGGSLTPGEISRLQQAAAVAAMRAATGTNGPPRRGAAAARTMPPKRQN